MKKIPTLFLRNLADLSTLTRTVNPDCRWVADGEGVATRKYDGTCVMYDGSRWWSRREVKPGKKTPPEYAPISTDTVTGKTVGWEPIESSAFVKFHREAALGDLDGWFVGTYELIGPKINGNPESTPWHALVCHDTAQTLDAPRDFDGLSAWLVSFRGEGIVWHHPDGRMAKIKRRDFGL